MGIPRRGALIRGAVGLLCGVAMALAAYPGQTDKLVQMAGAAGAYGAVGGLLLGHILQKPRVDEAGS